jgi:hypothetical protein
MCKHPFRNDAVPKSQIARIHSGMLRCTQAENRTRRLRNLAVRKAKNCAPSVLNGAVRQCQK